MFRWPSTFRYKHLSACTPTQTHKSTSTHTCTQLPSRWDTCRHPSWSHRQRHGRRPWEGSRAAELPLDVKLCQDQLDQPSPPTPQLCRLTCWSAYLLVLVGEGEPLDGVLYCSPSHVSQPVLELQQLLQRENVWMRALHTCRHTDAHTTRQGAPGDVSKDSHGQN